MNQVILVRFQKLIILNMATEVKFGLMEQDTLVIGVSVKLMDLEFSIMLMVIHLKEILEQIKQMEKEYIDTKLDKNMKEIGLMIFSTAQELKF
jgi:hypothetical protein